MDIEDLFNENFEEIKEDSHPLVIPDFGPCGDESHHPDDDTATCSATQNCCKDQKCDCEEEKKVTTVPVVKANPLEGKGVFCFKCKKNPPSFTNKQDKVCKQCFLEITVHKFKSSLRGNLKIWKDDLNLICVSGGSHSMALLHMMHESLFGSSNRKMFFKVHVLHIEESAAVYGISEEQRQKNIDFIVNICKSYNFSYTVIPIEQIYSVSTEIDLKAIDESVKAKIEEEKKQDELNHSQPVGFAEIENKILDVDSLEAKRDRLKALIECLPVHSNFREDLILYIKKWIIAEFGLKYNFKKILLGTSGHKVATLLLSQLAKGRGSSIAHEISYVDDKNFGGRITFMNPMREFLHKEVSLYNYLNKVEIIPQRSLAQLSNTNSGVPSFGSADMLIERFFDRLQDKFNVNTVPTVVKLTNKLQKNDFKGPYPFCPLCFGIREEVKNLLEMGSTIKSITPLENGSFDVKTISSADEWLSSEIEKAFCFGCKRMAITAVKKDEFVNLLPDIVKINCERTLLSL